MVLKVISLLYDNRDTYTPTDSVTMCGPSLFKTPCSSTMTVGQVKIVACDSKLLTQKRVTIGMCLTETLDEMVSNGILSPELAIQILVQFDKVSLLLISILNLFSRSNHA
uniref:Putative transcription initiation factor IIA, gamma subunit n=1 Tax=Helianthus annuus TaxID=4232 RepID=A0A251TFK4_HELAN